MRASRSLLQTALCLVVLLLAACGGSSDGSNTAGLPPTATIKIPVSVPVTAVVTLDGSGSTANGGRTLTYSWTLTSKPTGSAATISNPSIAQPTMTIDVAGNYTVALVVNDGASSQRVSSSLNGSTGLLAIASDILEPVSGSVNLGFTFDPGITTVDWTVDGVAIGSGASVAWNTASVANGTHVVRAHLNFAANEYVYDLTKSFQVSQTPVSFTGTKASESLGAFTAITGAQSINGIVRVATTVDGVALATLTAPNACLDSTGAACATAGLNGYSFSSTIASGNHVIVFTATDGGGNSLSTQVGLSVSDVP